MTPPNDTAKELPFKILRLVLEKMIEALEYALAMLRKFNKWISEYLPSTRRRPTILQWANRLLEYMDGQYILEAAKRFVELVDFGVDPEHAFRMVVDS